MNARQPGPFAPATGRVRAPASPLARPFVLSRIARLVAGIVPVLAAGAASAQDAADTPTQQVVVTAARVAQKLPDTLPATTVITRTEIEASPATDVPDLLRLMTSFDVAQTGPLGSQTSVFVRGANSNQVLVLVDGAPLSRADFGSAPWELIPLGQVDHVEIVRGNLSSLYGSQAVGGVVQIFTRQGSGAGVSLAAGNRGTLIASGSIGRRIGDAATPLDLNAAVSAQHTDGYSAENAATNPGANPDRDPATQAGASLRVGKTWAQGQRTEVSFMHSYTQSNYDGLTTHVHQDTLTTDLDAFNLRSTHELGQAFKLELNAGETLVHYDDPTESDGSFGPNATYGSGLTRQLGAQLDWQVAAAHGLQFAVESKNERFGTELDPQHNRQTKSVRVGYVGDFAHVVDVQANLRHDDADDFGKANTGLLALGWRMTPAWKVVGQVSTAFTAPSFSDQEFATSPTALKPERSRDLEFGVHWTGAAWTARATWFSQRQRDLITFLSVPPFSTVNIGHATNKGVELAADGTIGPGKLGLDATFQNPRDDDAHVDLKRRARTSAAVSYRLPIMGWETGVWLRYTGKRADSDPATFATAYTPTRTAIGLSTQHALSENWTLGLKVDNLNNSQSPEVLGYTAPQREVLVTLRGQWQ